VLETAKVKKKMGEEEGSFMKRGKLLWGGGRKDKARKAHG